MNCDSIEELLPRYHEGDLTNEERAAVAGHLASCARCRESNAAFATLERALMARRDELPQPGEIARGVLAHLQAPRERTTRWPRWATPALAGIVVLAALLLSLTRGTALTEAIGDGYGTFVDLLVRMPGWIAAAAGGEWWILLSVYLALTVSFVVAGSMIYRRITME